MNEYNFGMNVRLELNETHVRLMAFYIHTHEGIPIHKIGKTKINKELKRMLSNYGTDIISLFGENLINEYSELENSEKLKYEKVKERYFYRDPTRYL